MRKGASVRSGRGLERVEFKPIPKEEPSSVRIRQDGGGGSEDMNADFDFPEIRNGVRNDIGSRIKALLERLGTPVSKLLEKARNPDLPICHQAVLESCVAILVGNVSDQIERIAREAEMMTAGFSPENLDKNNLLIELTGLRFADGKYLCRQIQKALKNVGVEVLADLVEVNGEGRLVMKSEKRLSRNRLLGSADVKHRLLYFCVKYLPLGKVLTGAERKMMRSVMGK